MSISFLDGRAVLHPGNCLDVLPDLDADSIDSCVTDPPYHLTSIVKRFGADGAAPAKSNGVYGRSSRGFMGKTWDGGDIAFKPETWEAVLRVLKPGAHLVAFGAPKNFGFMQCAIAQAGFEIRDVLAWVFGSGFPKNHNIGEGWGTALKPAYEPILLCRKPLIGTVAANVALHGTGALNIDGCRVAAGDKTPAPVGQYGGSAIGPNGHSGIRNSNADNLGRWPANVIHDGSDEAASCFPPATSGGNGKTKQRGESDWGMGEYQSQAYGDSGSAARFFYTAKADADDRLGSKHPTVKPIDLIQYLVRLVTPKGGLVLDPFAGTGTTGEAAWREGMRAILIERESEYQDDIRRRMALCLAGPDERARESIKARMKDKPIDAGPLFGATA